MISSMTAYARKSLEYNGGTITWELRAVNHRFRELNIRLPEQFRHLEPKLRTLVSEKIARGKLDLGLKFQAGPQNNSKVNLNKDAAANLQTIINDLKSYLPDANINLSELVSWPGLLVNKQADDPQLDAACLEHLNNTLDALCTLRQSEGKTIQECLQKLLTHMQSEINIIAQNYAAITDRMRSKLQARLAELETAINQERLEQEIVYWLNKMDIAEECQRFQAHLAAVAKLIEKAEPIGRKLDFYAQELNREANTIGSKLTDMDIAQHIVHIKVAIEQLREQAQNIE